MDPARHHTDRRAHRSRIRASCGPSTAPANSRFCAAGPTCSHISGRPTSRAPASHARSMRARARASFSARTGPAPIWIAAAWNTSTSGLDRPLRTPEHFENYAGEKVRVKAYGPIAELESRKTFVGMLRGFEDGRALVEVDGKLFPIPLEQIAKAHVEARLDDLAAS